MPQMDGVQLAGRFRNMFPDAKILLMSGYAEEPDTRRAIPDPSVEFLPKPFLLQELMNRVREVLNQ